MCILFFAFKQHSDYPIVFVANRDEYYQRPTRIAQFWEDEYPDLLAGKDLQSGGTWLGINRKGQFCFLTNYRDPKFFKENRRSRGELLLQFLTKNHTLQDYQQYLFEHTEAYNGYNLVFGNKDQLYYYSNIQKQLHCLQPGYYGLSNHFLNTPWPKITRGLSTFRQLLTSPFTPETFFPFMQDETKAKDEELPQTGIGLETERFLSSIFISSPHYGTRSTTVILIDSAQKVQFVEQNYPPKPGKTLEYSFEILLS